MKEDPNLNNKQINPVFEIEKSIPCDNLKLCHLKDRIEKVYNPIKLKEEEQKVSLTFAFIWVGNRRYVGIARCRSDLDNFNKRKGREIAINRALFIFNKVNNPKFDNKTRNNTDKYYSIFEINEERQINILSISKYLSEYIDNIPHSVYFSKIEKEEKNESES